jgi:hypothetical protein
VNIKDVKWLTIKLADDSEEISRIKCKLDQLKTNGNKHANTNNKLILTLKTLLILKQKHRLFKIPPEQHKVSVTLTPICLCGINETFKCQMTMFPLNINTSSTGHKLQGRSKDMVIMSSYPKPKNNICFSNWEYKVLSCVRTLKRSVFQPIDMEHSFKPTEDLMQFMKCAEHALRMYFYKSRTSH